MRRPRGIEFVHAYPAAAAAATPGASPPKFSLDTLTASSSPSEDPHRKWQADRASKVRHRAWFIRCKPHSNPILHVCCMAFLNQSMQKRICCNLTAKWNRRAEVQNVASCRVRPSFCHPRHHAVVNPGAESTELRPDSHDASAIFKIHFVPRASECVLQGLRTS